MTDQIADDFETAVAIWSCADLQDLLAVVAKRVVTSLSLPCGVIQQMIWVRLFWNEVFRNSELEMGAGRNRCLKIG